MINCHDHELQLDQLKTKLSVCHFRSVNWDFALLIKIVSLTHKILKRYYYYYYKVNFHTVIEIQVLHFTGYNIIHQFSLFH